MQVNTIIQGDVREVLKTLPDKSIHCCVTSPPYYGLRDYGMEGQVGLEETPEEYVANMVEIFRGVRRVLRDDGTLWLNLGDSYATTPTGGDSRKSGLNGAYTSEKYQRTIKDVYKKKHNTITPGLKPKDLIGIPWRVAFALQADGWWLRQDIIWHKPNPMPESVTDRCVKAHEYMFLLTKSEDYYFDDIAIVEPAAYDGGKDTKMKGSPKYKNSVLPGQTAHSMAAKGHGRRRRNERGEPIRNKRSVWTVATMPFSEAHFAVFPPDLIRPCILAGAAPQVCEICGASWERVIEKIKANQDTIIKTVGWRPTCSCKNEGKGKSIVLDPFMGSGTTALVAFEHERNYLGIELNPEYIKLANRRLERRKRQGLQVSMLGR